MHAQSPLMKVLRFCFSRPSPVQRNAEPVRRNASGGLGMGGKAPHSALLALQAMQPPVRPRWPCIACNARVVGLALLAMQAMHAPSLALHPFGMHRMHGWPSNPIPTNEPQIFSICLPSSRGSPPDETLNGWPTNPILTRGWTPVEITVIGLVTRLLSAATGFAEFPPIRI